MTLETTMQLTHEITSFTIRFGQEKPYEAEIELSDGTKRLVKITNEKLETDSIESIRRLATDLLSKEVNPQPADCIREVNPQPADCISNPGVAKALRTQDQELFWSTICSGVDLKEFKNEFILEVDKSTFKKPKYKASYLSLSDNIVLGLRTKDDKKPLLRTHRKVNLWKEVNNDKDIALIQNSLSVEIHNRLKLILGLKINEESSELESEDGVLGDYLKDCAIEAIQKKDLGGYKLMSVVLMDDDESEYPLTSRIFDVRMMKFEDGSGLKREKFFLNFFEQVKNPFIEMELKNYKSLEQELLDQINELFGSDISNVKGETVSQSADKPPESEER